MQTQSPYVDPKLDLRCLRRLALCLLGLLLGASSAHSQVFRFEQYTINDGLPSATIFAIEQDEQGALWIGTELGLCRFNGKDFSSYGVIDGLPGNSIFLIHPDDDRLWLATLSGIGHWSEEGYTPVPAPEGANKLKSLKVGPDGTYYFAARDNLYRYEDGKAVELEYNLVNANRLGKISLQLVDGEDIWMASNNQVFRYRDGEIRRLYKGQTQRSNFVLKDDEGRTLYVSSRVIREIVGDSLIPIYPAVEALLNREADRAPKAFDENPRGLSSLLIDSEGNWWIGTFNSGLFFIPKDGLAEGRAEAYMVDEAVMKLFEDRDGNLWVGTDESGLQLLSYRARKVRNYRGFDQARRQQLFSRQVKLKDGSEWQYRNGKMVLRRNSDSIILPSFGIVYQVAKGPSDSVYLSASTGLYGLSVEDIDALESEGLEPKARTQAARDRFRIFNEPTRVIWHDSVINRSWFYSAGGIFTARGKRVDTIAANSDEHKYIISGIDGVAAEEHVWLSSYGHGLYLWNGDSLVQFTESNGLNSNNLIEVDLDQSGSIWVFGSHGVNQLVDFNYENQTCRTLSLYENDGLVMGEVRAACVLRDTVWLNTNAGITLFPAGLIEEEPKTNPGIEITGVVVNDEDTTVQSSYDLKYNQNDLEIRFSGIAFSDSRKVRYLYRMIGFDDEWKESDYGEVRLASMRPGDYTFEVKAIDIYGMESRQPEVIRFNIHPALWQQAWFQILAVLLTILGIFISFRTYFAWRTRRREAQLVLEKQLAETEQKALRAQMNPHFIYNVLNSIQQFILRKDTISALDYLSDFGDLIRKSLENSKHLAISLQDEINFIKVYLDLEKMRFDDKMDYDIRIGESIDTHRTFVPSLLIQPFVENSIRHGLKHNHGEGRIDIRFTRHEDTLTCEIVDDGIGINKAKELEGWQPEEHRSSGMEITRNRLELFNRVSARQVGMEVFDRSIDGDTGTRVVLTIPILDVEQNPAAIYGEGKENTINNRRRRKQKPRIPQ